MQRLRLQAFCFGLGLLVGLLMLVVRADLLSCLRLFALYVCVLGGWSFPALVWCDSHEVGSRTFRASQCAKTAKELAPGQNEPRSREVKIEIEV